MRVTGVYRDLAAGGRPLEPYWSPLASAVHTLSVTMDTPPPPVLVDPDRFLAVRALAAKGSCCLVATHSEELLAGVDRVLAISDGRLLGRP